MFPHVWKIKCRGTYTALETQLTNKKIMAAVTVVPSFSPSYSVEFLGVGGEGVLLASLPFLILLSKSDMISEEQLPTFYDCSSSSLGSHLTSSWCHLVPICQRFWVNLA